jgi:hypothetical protein
VKISDRLADYVVMGGFFWAVQLMNIAALGAADQGWKLSLRSLSAFAAATPKEAIVPIAAIVGTLTLIVVFTTGVFIDLLGSFYFKFVEAKEFKAHAGKNAVWMNTLMVRYAHYVQNDWTIILDVPLGWNKRSWAIGLKGTKFWNMKAMKEWAAAVKSLLAARRAYTRMHSFLFAWISLMAGADKIELLNTQLSLWSVSRAFAMTLAIVAIEAATLASRNMFRYIDPRSPEPTSSWIASSWLYVGIECGALPALWSSRRQKRRDAAPADSMRFPVPSDGLTRKRRCLPFTPGFSAIGKRAL